MARATPSPASPPPKKAKKLEPGYYHLEVRPDCVRDVITYGGVTFHKKTFSSREREDGKIAFDLEHVGQTVYLDEIALKAIEAAKGKKVLRIVSERTGRSQIHRKDARHYRPRPDDIPLERFLILRPTEDPATVQEEVQTSFLVEE